MINKTDEQNHRKSFKANDQPGFGQAPASLTKPQRIWKPRKSHGVLLSPLQKGITCWRRKPRLFWLTQRQINYTAIAIASEKTRKVARNIPRNYPWYADSLLTFIGKLFWISDIKPPQNIENAFFFNIDGDLKYAPFNKDFGPLNLAMVHRYCRELAKLLEKNEFKG